MSEHLASSSPDAWYALSGNEDDVVLATTMVLRRNLANFPFPQKLSKTESQRIQSLVFDAFNHLKDAESFQAISVSHLDSLVKKVLQERGILDFQDDEKIGIILRTDGKVSCAVNDGDHLRLNVFVSGLNFENVSAISKEIDLGLQQKLQFAASYDFGYLTSDVFDAGSGMKLSLKFHLPSLSFQSRIRGLANDMIEKGISFEAHYGTAKQGTALGAFYTITSINSQTGGELDQIASVVSAGRRIADLERAAREECKKNNLTEVRNALYRAVALSRSSLFIPLREAIELVSTIKWGLDMGLLTGIEDSFLHALLYRIQEAHLEYFWRNGTFEFENDITNDYKKNERLRALILQEAFEALVLV